MIAITLISGGLDSIVATALARRDGSVVHGITIDYGQRAAGREIEASRRVCEELSIPHEVIAAPWLAAHSDSALVRADRPLPAPALEDLDGAAAERSADAVWVPNRNGVMANIAASRAEALGADAVIVGFNAEEAGTFPDNSAEFVESLNAAFAYSTRNRVRVIAPVAHLAKHEILSEAKRVDAPLAHVWPCYESGDELCGKCESCIRFFRALERANLAGWYKSLLRSTPSEGAIRDSSK